MDEEAAKPRDSTTNQQRQYYYGTFQGVANYPPPAPPPQLLPLLQQPQHPIATNPIFPGHGYQNVQDFFFNLFDFGLLLRRSVIFVCVCV